MSDKTLDYAPPILDQAQVDTFHQNGFTVVRNLIPTPMIDELRIGYDDAVNGKYPVDGWKHRLGPDRILQLGMPHTHISPWNGHPYLARLVAVGKQLLGEDIEYKYDQLIYKPPHNPVELLWHQDAGYGWPGKANYRSLTGWLAFSPVTKEMGSMQFLPGSHLEGIAEHVDASHRNPIGGALEAVVDASQAVTIEFGPGDATFHHGRTLHYTSGNSTDQPRRGLSTHMWPEPNE